VAEDTDGQLMLTTSDPVATREVLAAIAQEYEERQAPSEQPADLQSSA
jgi:hypothetical protein